MNRTRRATLVVTTVTLGGAVLGILLQLRFRNDALLLILKATGIVTTVATAFFWQLVKELKDLRGADHLDPMRTKILRERADGVRRRSWSKLWVVFGGAIIMTVCGFSSGILKGSVAIPAGFSAFTATVWAAASLFVAYRHVGARVEHLTETKADRQRRLESIGRSA